MLTALAAGAMLATPCEAMLRDYRTWQPASDQNWSLALSAPGGGTATLFGAEHLRDPAAAQFAQIATAFAAARPTLALFEGPDRGTAESADEAVRSTGESGYLRFLAKGAGIPVRSLEPSPLDAIAALRRSFPDDRILLFFLLREAIRLRDREGKTGEALDAAVAGMVARAAPLAAKAGLATTLTDLDSLGAAAAREWPGRDWRSFPANWFSPIRLDAAAGFLTDINAADSSFRDAHILRQVAEAARGGERVFVVIGRNHVPMIEPALRCALR